MSPQVHTMLNRKASARRTPESIRGFMARTLGYPIASTCTNINDWIATATFFDAIHTPKLNIAGKRCLLIFNCEDFDVMLIQITALQMELVKVSAE